MKDFEQNDKNINVYVSTICYRSSDYDKGLKLLEGFYNVWLNKIEQAMRDNPLHAIQLIDNMYTRIKPLSDRIKTIDKIHKIKLKFIEVIERFLGLDQTQTKFVSPILEYNESIIISLENYRKLCLNTNKESIIVLLEKMGKTQEKINAKPFTESFSCDTAVQNLTEQTLPVLGQFTTELSQPEIM